eukprot:scaffold16051_cov31-Prasinocladus_malaysianus.AAC.1
MNLYTSLLIISFLRISIHRSLAELCRSRRLDDAKFEDSSVAGKPRLRQHERTMAENSLQSLSAVAIISAQGSIVLGFIKGPSAHHVATSSASEAGTIRTGLALSSSRQHICPNFLPRIRSRHKSSSPAELSIRSPHA